MANDSSFLVYFTGAATLDDAERVLRKTSLSVSRTNDTLQVRWGQGPMLWIGLRAAAHVKLEALEVAEDKGVAQLGLCDRRFEVGFDDLDAVLDETNTLAEVQMTLQDLTRGWITMSWNGELMAPEPNS